MRKLSKKISMLMVLAMLVSLFSGIVSASAASSWSFYDRTAEETVERNATYVMEKDQYANFDLYKDGAEASTKEYKYTWYSDDASVVYVDSTNGRLRAQKDAEAGEKAFIYVLIDNKTTEKNENAKRGFYIEIAADEVVVPEVPEVEYAIKADFADETFVVGLAYDLTAVVTADGVATDAKVAFTVDGKALEGKFAPDKECEYTIVATATVDEKEITETFIVEAAIDNSFKVKQTSMTSFTLTFTEGLDLSKVTKADVSIAEAAAIDGAKVVVPVKSITGKANVVTVELYQELTKDSYVFAKYLDGEYVGFKVGKGKVASVVVSSKDVMVGEFAALEIKFYDENDVEITSADELAKVTLDVVSGKENCTLAGNTILFWEKEKTAGVVATYHTYDFMTNNDGTEVVVKSAAASVTSKEKVVSYSGVNAWALAKADSDWTKLPYASSVQLSLSDSGLKIAGKLTQTTVTTKVETKDVYTKDLAGYYFESANKEKLLVLPDGTLIPVATGNVDVLLKDKDGKVKSVATVIVVAAREKNTISLSPNKNTMSTVAGDSIVVTVTVNDQFGAACSLIAGDIAIKDVAKNADVAIDGTVIKFADGKLTFTGLAAGTYTYSITVNKKVAYVSFTVKAPEAATAFKLNASTKALSTKIEAKTDKALADVYKDAVVSIVGYDKNNYLTNEEKSIVKRIDSPATVDAAGDIAADNFYVVVNGPDGYKNWVNVVGGKLVLTNLKVDAANKISKAPAGNYSVTLYKAAAVGATGKVSFAYQDSITITVADGQPGYTAKLVKNSTSAAAKADVVAVSAGALDLAINDCFEIYNAKNEKAPQVNYFGLEQKNANNTVVFYSVKFDEGFQFADAKYYVEQKINLLTSPISFAK